MRESPPQLFEFGYHSTAAAVAVRGLQLKFKMLLLNWGQLVFSHAVFRLSMGAQGRSLSDAFYAQPSAESAG